MRIALIAAMAKNRVIGLNNQMPWHLSEDLRHFKAITMGKPIVMGRKTFESIGKALPGRHNIVLTRQTDFSAAGVTRVSSFEEAMAVALPCEELVVIGGGQLYLQTLPLAKRFYLTEIDIEVTGDTFFPHWDDGSWEQESLQEGQTSEGLGYKFINLSRKC